MLEIIPISALEDNYIWLIHNNRHAVAVDPGEAAPVLDYLRRHQLALAAVLNTHHHHDHVEGNAGLLEHFPVAVYGPLHESIATVTHKVGEGITVEIPGLALQFSVLDIPGHTAGHVAYYGANSLFCGDTLFGCGCGRLFEGSAAQMYASLQKLARLPDDTRVYCAHEYTLANIRFARTVEPGNKELLARETRDREMRARSSFPPCPPPSAWRSSPIHSCAAASRKSFAPPAALPEGNYRMKSKCSPRCGNGRTASSRIFQKAPIPNGRTWISTRTRPNSRGEFREPALAFIHKILGCHKRKDQRNKTAKAMKVWEAAICP